MRSRGFNARWARRTGYRHIGRGQGDQCPRRCHGGDQWGMPHIPTCRGDGGGVDDLLSDEPRQTQWRRLKDAVLNGAAGCRLKEAVLSGAAGCRLKDAVRSRAEGCRREDVVLIKAAGGRREEAG